MIKNNLLLLLNIRNLPIMNMAHPYSSSIIQETIFYADSRLNHPVNCKPNFARRT